MKSNLLKQMWYCLISQKTRKAFHKLWLKICLVFLSWVWQIPQAFIQCLLYTTLFPWQLNRNTINKVIHPTRCLVKLSQSLPNDNKSSQEELLIFQVDIGLDQFNKIVIHFQNHLYSDKVKLCNDFSLWLF